MTYCLAMLQLWILLFICLLVGRRFVDILPCTVKRSMAFYIAPILGLAFWVLCATGYGWLSPFKWVYSLPLVMIVLVISFIYEPKKKAFSKDVLYLGAFSVLCSLPILTPLIRYSGYNPFTDIFTYLAQAQWLQDHAFTEKVVTSGYYPAFTQIALYQVTGSRMGGTFFLAFVQSLFHLTWSYHAYMSTVAVGFVTGSLAIGGIVRQIIPAKKIVVLALALLPSLLSNGFIFGAEWGFYPQTLGLAFAAGVCVLLPSIVQYLRAHSSNFFDVARYVLPLALCTAALLFAYNEPFPIFAAGLFLFLVLVGLSSPRQIKTLFIFFAFYVVETLVFINYEAIRIFKNLYQTLAISNGFSDIGWPVLWTPLQFVAFAFGMKSPFNGNRFFIDTLTSEIIAPLILVVMLFTLMRFIKTESKRRLTLLFLLCMEFVLLLFFCKFRYFSPNKSLLEVGNTFLQFKIAKYAAPFSLALLVTFVAILWQTLKTYRRHLVWIYSIIFIIGLAWHTCIVSKNFTIHFLNSVQQQHDPFDVLLKLRARVADVPPSDVIHVALGEEQSKLRQLIAYVFYDRKMSSDYRDDGYIVGHLPTKDANMPIGKASRLIIMKHSSNTSSQDETLIGPFAIQKPPFHFILSGKQQGGYDSESSASGDTWNWVKQAIDIPFSITGDVKAVQINFQLRSHEQSRIFHVTLKSKSGTILARYTIHLNTGVEKPFHSERIALDGHNELILQVEADGKPTKLSIIDARMASFKIANVSLALATPS